MSSTGSSAPLLPPRPPSDALVSSGGGHHSNNDGAITTDTLSYLLRGTRDVSHRCGSGRAPPLPRPKEDAWLTRTVHAMAKKNVAPLAAHQGFLSALETYSGASTTARISNLTLKRS